MLFYFFNSATFSRILESHESQILECVKVKKLRKKRK